MRLVVPASEQEPAYRLARVAAGAAEVRLETEVFVDPMPGEGAAWRGLANQEPDGLQIGYVTQDLAVSGGAGVDPGDLVPVAGTDAGSAVLAVRADSAYGSSQVLYESLGELLEEAAEEPGSVRVGDAGPGSVYRLAAEALGAEAGARLAHVGLGGSAEAALLAWEVEAVVAPAEEVMPGVEAGEVEVLAVLGEERSGALPGVRTARELGYDASVPVWAGIAAPEGTTPGVVAELGRAFEAAVASPEFEKAARETGRRPSYRGPSEFAEYVEEQSRLLSAGVTTSGEGP